jgi:hypothetical protein
MRSLKKSLWTGRRCGYGIDADLLWPLRRVSRARWHSRIDRRSLSGNFERGEIVSPVGCIASKVGKPNLVMLDARHRRPLKFLLYHASVKTQPIAPPKATRIQLRSKCCFGWECFHPSLRSTETAERSSRRLYSHRVSLPSLESSHLVRGVSHGGD